VIERFRKSCAYRVIVLYKPQPVSSLLVLIFTQADFCTAKAAVLHDSSKSITARLNLHKVRDTGTAVEPR